MRRGQAGFLATEATDSLHLALCSRSPESRRVRAQADSAAEGYDGASRGARPHREPGRREDSWGMAAKG